MALQHLRSSTANKRPTPGAMSDGQLALNTNLNSPGLFFKDSNGDSVKIGPIHVGATAPNATPGAGGQAGNSKGEAWLDTTATNPILKVWNGSAFVAVQPVGTGTVVSTTDTGTVTSTMILDGTILNADVNASAAIAYSKLAALTSANILVGNASNVATSTAVTGDVTISNAGVTAIAAGAIVNADVNASAAIAGTKISPDFGSQTITTTGIVSHALGTAGAPTVTFTGDTDTGIYSPGADILAFVKGGAEAMRIDSSGRLLVGTSSAVPVGINPGFQLASLATANGAHFNISRFNNDSGAGALSFGKSRSGTVGTVGTVGSILLNNDTLGAISFYGDDGEDLNTIAASIQAFVDGTPGENDMPGRLVFSTRADGAASPTERLRIDSSGRLLVGTSSASGANFLQVNSDALINGITVGRGLASVSTNTAVGNGALQANTTGINNTAVGKDALDSNTTGSSNTATGVTALRDNTTGTNNTATGVNALRDNTTGTNNTATGVNALLENTTGESNTANGVSALANNTTGDDNTAVGRDALFSSTTGINNTANGYRALYSNTTGGSNVAVGHGALFSMTTGGNNVAVGHGALDISTNGGSNTAIGFDAGNLITSGGNNTCIGNGSDPATATTSNTVTLGNSSIATLRCQATTITSLSDARDKTNITTLPAGLDFINALRPVAFDWNTRDGKKVGIHEFGFIAQELQEAQASTGITVPNLVSTENPDKLEASAGTLLPVLVNAVQELAAMVRDLQAELSIIKGA